MCDHCWHNNGNQRRCCCHCGLEEIITFADDICGPCCEAERPITRRIRAGKVTQTDWDYAMRFVHG